MTSLTVPQQGIHLVVCRQGKNRAEEVETGFPAIAKGPK
jgi:hypothetical protein